MKESSHKSLFIKMFACSESFVCLTIVKFISNQGKNVIKTCQQRESEWIDLYKNLLWYTVIPFNTNLLMRKVSNGIQ
jgi:hypothetical protein